MSKFFFFKDFRAYASLSSGAPLPLFYFDKTYSYFVLIFFGISFKGKLQYASSRIDKRREIVSRRETLGKAEKELETSDKIGAMRREKGLPLNEKLREERVYKGGNPVVKEAILTETGAEKPKTRTGVFDRNLPGKRDERETNSDERPRPRSESPKEREAPVETPPIFVPRKDDDGDSKPRERSRKENATTTVRAMNHRPPTSHLNSAKNNATSRPRATTRRLVTIRHRKMTRRPKRATRQ